MRIESQIFCRALLLLALGAGVGCSDRQQFTDARPATKPAAVAQAPQERWEASKPLGRKLDGDTPVNSAPLAAIPAEQMAGKLATATDAAAPMSRPARRERLDSLKKSGSPIWTPVAPQLAPIRYASEPLDREQYAHYDPNPIKRVVEQPVSTFSIDVDTGAYANVRRLLLAGRLPPRDAVRVEELVNYFDYAYPAPRDERTPFRVTTEIAPTPWNPDTRILHIGIKGYRAPKASLPSANLVFLVDVSGSMNQPNKLPLLKSALRLLVRQLGARDRISLAVYAGAAGVVLGPTPGNQQARIEGAIDALGAGGSTNGAAGIRRAYALARQAFIPGAINRVLLATDGDFNVGTVNFQTLKDLVGRQRRDGISLTTLGFGSGNYNDRLMEQLADVGNGNYSYIDSLREANKVLVEEMAATLHTIAKDVKIQIEFNPAVVAEYRLIGYENRALRREDFNNDRVDAGEIGAGHTVTALYELALVGHPGRRIEPLRYATDPRPVSTHDGELGYLRLRYKRPGGEHSLLIERRIGAESIEGPARTTPRFSFAAAVAAFGQILKGGRYTGAFGLDQVLALARTGRGNDANGYRGEFISLLGLARTLSGPAQAPARNRADAG